MEQQIGRKAKTIQHRGVEIIITDYSGLKGRELTDAMKENAKVIIPKIMGRRDCVMVNLFNNCLLDEESVKYIGRVQKAMDGVFVASALVGLSEIQKAGIEITGALRKSTFATEFFDDEKEAMDWAAAEYKKFTNRPQ